MLCLSLLQFCFSSSSSSPSCGTYFYRILDWHLLVRGCYWNSALVLMLVLVVFIFRGIFAQLTNQFIHLSIHPSNYPSNQLTNHPTIPFHSISISFIHSFKPIPPTFTFGSRFFPFICWLCVIDFYYYYYYYFIHLWFVAISSGP